MPLVLARLSTGDSPAQSHTARACMLATHAAMGQSPSSGSYVPRQSMHLDLKLISILHDRKRRGHAAANSNACQIYGRVGRGCRYNALFFKKNWGWRRGRKSKEHLHVPSPTLASPLDYVHLRLFWTAAVQAHHIFASFRQQTCRCTQQVLSAIFPKRPQYTQCSDANRMACFAPGAFQHCDARNDRY